MSGECVRNHPKNAFEAWRRVVPLEAGRQGEQYLQDWRDQNAYQGLNHARRVKGSMRRDPLVRQSTSIREQYTMDHTLDTIPDEAAAKERACVVVHDKHMSKKDRQAFNTKCGGISQCFSVNDQGEFETAADRAKTAFSKEQKPQVAVGFCMNAVTTRAANLQNKHYYTENAQRLQDRVMELEAELRKLRNQDFHDTC